MTKRISALTLVVLLAAACGGGRGASRPTKPVPVDPPRASLGERFELGNLTLTITRAPTPTNGTPGSPVRVRLVVRTENRSTASDRAPGLAVVCERPPGRVGGSLYADAVPRRDQFVAGAPAPPGTDRTGSVAVVPVSTCATPVLQVSTGGATVNGLPRPVVVPVGDPGAKR